MTYLSFFIIIAGDAVRPVHSSRHQALNEGSPVLRCFGKANRNAQYHAPPGFSFNTNGNKCSTITYDFIPSHFGIRGIEEKMGYGRNGAISPFLKQGIKLSAANPYYDCYEEGADGFLKLSKGEIRPVNRQAAPQTWQTNGSIYVINPHSLRTTPMTAFNKKQKFIMDELYSIDLDTVVDWKLAEI